MSEDERPSTQAIMSAVISEMHQYKGFRWWWDALESEPAFLKRELIERLVKAIEGAKNKEDGDYPFIDVEADEDE